MHYQFNITDWVGYNPLSEEIIPGRFAQVMDRRKDAIGRYYKLMNEFLSDDNPLWVKEGNLVSFDYTSEHPLYSIKFNFEYWNQGQQDGEYVVSIPNLTSQLAPIAMTEYHRKYDPAIAIKRMDYRLWNGKLWTTKEFRLGMTTELDLIKSEYSSDETKTKIGRSSHEEVLVDISPD